VRASHGEAAFVDDGGEKALVRLARLREEMLGREHELLRALIDLLGSEEANRPAGRDDEELPEPSG
jgi:hypothetical protein